MGGSRGGVRRSAQLPLGKSQAVIRLLRTLGTDHPSRSNWTRRVQLLLGDDLFYKFKRIVVKHTFTGRLKTL